MSEKDFERLEDFVTNHSVAVRSAKPLKTGVEVGIIFTKDNFECRFVKERKSAKMYRGKAKNPDFELYVGEKVIEHMMEMDSNDIGEFGIEFFKHIMNRTPEENVRPKFHIGFFKMVSHGYIRVIMLGGIGLFKWLAKNGVSIKSIKSAFERMKRDTDKL